MKTMWYVCVTLLFFAGICAAQPSIDSVGAVNLANRVGPGLPNYGVARGSIMAIIGKGLGPDQLQQASFPLAGADGLAGTSVQVSVGGASVDALMVYASATEVAALLPSTAPLGDGTVTVTVNGQKSAAAPIKIVEAAFGIFTQNLKGTGAAIAQMAVSDTEFPFNGLTATAAPGQTMNLYGTGTGAITGDETATAAAEDVPGDFHLFVGGKEATVLYRGPAVCCTGLDQVGFPVPQGAAGLHLVKFVVPDGVDGCRVPVAVRQGDIVSNFASISVAASGAACSDASGLSADDMQAFAAAGSARIGGITLSRTSAKVTMPSPIGTIETQNDSGSGSFNQYDYSKLAGSTSAFSSVSIGSCTVVTFRGKAGDTLVDPAQPRVLDAGPQINLSGPKGKKTLVRKDGAYYADLGSGMSGLPALPPGLPGIPGLPGGQAYLDAGAYTADNGSGGPDVGAFTATLTIPQPLVWTNRDAISAVKRTDGVTVTWSGGASNSLVQIIGMSANQVAVGMFICTERAPAGQFAVPALVTLSLPLSQGDVGGQLALQNGVSNKFTAKGLDVAYFTSSVLAMKSVAYQ